MRSRLFGSLQPDAADTTTERFTLVPVVTSEQVGGGKANTIGVEASVSPVPGRRSSIAQEFGPPVSQRGSPGIVGSGHGSSARPTRALSWRRTAPT